MKYEVRSTKSEAGSRKSEVGSWKSEVRCRKSEKLPTANCQLQTANWLLALCLLLFTGCYSFKDVSIPPEVKTIQISYLENRAPYINPQLAPQLNDKLRQKITNQTRLTIVPAGADADYDVSGYISNYTVSTAGISQQEAATNRLTVTVKITFKNQLDETKDFDVSRNFDFSANLSLPQAEAQLTETIIKNMVDEIFNSIFSNW